MKKLLVLLSIISFSNAYGQIRLISETMKQPLDSTLYRNIEYAFRMKVPSDIKVTDIRSSKGVLTKKDEVSFTYKTSSKDVDEIIYSYDIIKNEQVTKNIVFPPHYHVIDFPDSIMKLRMGSKTAGNISLKDFKKVSELNLNDLTCLIYMNCEFTHCKISILSSNTTNPRVLNLSSGQLAENKEYQNFMSTLKVGDTVTFDNIKIMSPASTLRALPSSKFIIHKQE